jgi:PAS domain S-box-containing protein
MNYHEGFRFLYPQYLYKGDEAGNQFQKEKPPVLLVKDFPTFDKLLVDKKLLILNMMQPNPPKDIKDLPGFKNGSMNNIVIFVLSVAQTVEGFFVLGRESIIKKFTRREIEDSEQLLASAIDALEENQILRQAKLTVKQLERIFELGTELTLDLSLDNILKKMCNAIRRTLGWNVVVLDLRNQFDNSYKTINVLGLGDSDYQKLIKTEQYPPFKNRVDTSYKISNSFFYDHLQVDLKNNGEVKKDYGRVIGTEWNDKDWLYVPITSRGKVLGMFSLNDPVERVKPNEDRIKSIEYFANQAAVIIENTELFDRLKSSELRYRLLAETMTMGLVTCDAAGKILYINNSLTRMLKYDSKKELTNRKIYDLCPSKIANKLQKEVVSTLGEKPREVEEHQEIQGLEIELMAKDEEIIPFMIYTSPFYQQKQKIGFFAVLADLRNQKKIERLRADFNSMIVHDLRSPLNIIQGYVDIVRNEVVGNINEEQAELLTIAKENVYKLLKLIDNFLIASKLEVGHLDIEPESNSINSLIDELYEHYQVLTKEKNLKLMKNLDQNIPMLNIDKFRIEQVIRNYLSNALKFTPPEGKITISSKLFKKKNTITGEMDMFVDVDVQDTGVGISKEELKKVFNKYEQTEAGKDASLKGTGLGLAICREVIELHHGEVWVESKLNEGSKFGFTLPIESIDI